MQLGRYQVSTLRPPPILSIDFSVDGRLFGLATETGYEIWRTAPLGLLRRRKLPGTLARALPLSDAPLVALQGGGVSPLYPPNKVVIYDDASGQAVAELEFSERVRGILSRRGAVFIALTGRVLAYEYGGASSAHSDARDRKHDTKGKGTARSTGFWVTKLGEWETVLNEHGLMAVSTTPLSTLLTIPGRQPGHVQLIHLPPCPPLSPNHATPTQTYRSPIILAHTHHLSSLACTANGSHIVTTSERGTLLRVWDTARGRLERELRRGIDRAEMWGAVLEEGILGFEGGHRGHDGALAGGRVVGWSDKGTVHMWGEAEQEAGRQQSLAAPSLTNLISRNIPLPKYFSSTPSTALYHLPRKNPHAFASTIGAAAEKARMPSMKMSQAAADEDGEWSERFVVGWIEVEAEVDAPNTVAPNIGVSTGKVKEELRGGINMGTREERRSFGSDRTATATTLGTVSGAVMGSSRTPTPTMGRNTPLIGGQSGASFGRVPLQHERSYSGSSRDTERASRRVTVSCSSPTDPSGARFREGGKAAGAAPKVKSRDRQLVAITFAGDWYRLRIPTASAASTETSEVSGPTGNEGEEEAKKARRLELVEYRRLDVGGGGW